MYPAGFDEVVGVAATDRDGYRWVHSNYGEWVDASAAGVNLRGVFVRGRENPRYDADGRAESWDHEINYARWSGTSFATPLVAAQIAVVKSAMSQRTPTTAWQAWEVLRDGSSPGDTGCGRRIYAYLPGQT
jgi:subtilisin family serine protease